MVLRLQADWEPAPLRRQPQDCVARRSPIRATAVLVAIPACLAVAACGTGQRPRPCPPVRLVKTADTVTLFRNGPGRDITDIAAQVRLVNFTGECDYDDAKAELDFAIDFVAEKGPANTSGAARFDYFVAIPRFFPNPAGKKTFKVAVKFADGARRVRLREEVKIAIPMDKKARPSRFPVYVGLQLTPEQLEYNRTRAPGP